MRKLTEAKWWLINWRKKLGKSVRAGNFANKDSNKIAEKSLSSREKEINYKEE